MKKISLIIIATFFAALVASSCNKKECPAYSSVDTEQADQNV